MNNQIQFINQELWWVALIIALSLVLVLVWKEWKGQFDTRFFINSLLGILAAAALLFLYLRPVMLTEVSGKAVILTENYNVAQLDSIKKKEKSIKVIRYKPGLDTSKSLDSISEVIVLGNGFSSYDFWQLKEVSTTYLRGVIPKGVVKLKYNNKLKIGSDLKIAGLYNKPTDGNHLVLETISGVGLDSIVLNDEEKQGFQLHSNLSVKGRYVYQLTEKDSTGNVLESNPVPVEVLETEQLRIFISNTFPSFETKYLKNFLAEEGHELVVRSQITKGRYKFEYFNTSKNPIYGFYENDLKDFDLLILDADTYLNLSKKNKNTLVKLVKEIGLGVFVQPSETLFRSTKQMVDFNVEKDVRQNNLKVENNLLETYPFKFQNTNPSGIAVANHSYALVVGKGKFSTTVLSNNYQLVLEGKTDAYSKIWSTIITTTAGTKEMNGAFESLKLFSIINEPSSFTLRTGTVKPMVIVNGEHNVPLIKNTLLEDRWQGKTYPKKVGWQMLQMASDTNIVSNYFVLDSVHWKKVIGANVIEDNGRFFDTTKKVPVKKMLPVELSRWLFFIVFLASMGCLWFLPKLKA